MINDHSKPHVVLIGAGIMSATLGVLIKQLEPNTTLSIFERLSDIALESSDAWNNAGTGHSAFCELNYTPQNNDKTIDISKALKIANSFEESKQLWSYLVKHHLISHPEKFIRTIPHVSFVWGKDNVEYLKKRVELLTLYPLFNGMQFSADKTVLKQWIPLVMAGRNEAEQVAATKMELGTDVDFGNLTRTMFDYLNTFDDVTIYLNHDVKDIERSDAKGWEITVKNNIEDKKHTVICDFVFIGAGGGALTLLEKSDIPEAEGYGGFPISGQWLKCTNESIIAQHHAKVYGKASVGAPPMSVPHLDTRIIDGKQALLFGPFAGFSTKFLKKGSYWDLTSSLELANIYPMISAGIHNLELTKYLIHQVRQSPEDRLDALKDYFPNAKMEDWELIIAGQRVQVIKASEAEGGVLEFGTEVVCSNDGSLAALLGASPGASTSVSVMLNVLAKCFPQKINSERWQTKLKEMIPSYKQSLATNTELCNLVREETHAILKLTHA